MWVLLLRYMSSSIRHSAPSLFNILLYFNFSVDVQKNVKKTWGRMSNGGRHVSKQEHPHSR